MMRIFPAALIMVVSLGSLAYADDVARINVIINGIHIEILDFARLTKGALDARIHFIDKDLDMMPSDAPLVYYAGNNTIWQSKQVHQDLGAWGRVQPSEQAAEDAYVAALALAAMDVGTAGEPWEGLYKSTPADRASRLALGKAVADALTEASDESATFASDQTAWVQLHVVAGTARSDAYALLKSHGLTAYNPEFAERRAIGNACLPPLDPNSGTWPHQNEPIPKSTGLCAFLGGNPKPDPNPDAMVNVLGRFGLGCDESVLTTISFGSDDRVSNVTASKPSFSCL